MCVGIYQARQDDGIAKIVHLGIGMSRTQFAARTDIQYSTIADKYRPVGNDRPNHRRHPRGTEKLTAGLP
jgi:hypothetical protein